MSVSRGRVDPEPQPWRYFAIAAIVTSIVAGFGLGGGLFLWLLDNGSAGVGWLAGSQVHGHAQMFGFAVTMVIGVALHFLPRLAGGAAVAARSAMAMLALMTIGLILRSLALLLLTDASERVTLLQWLLFVGIGLELAGVALAVTMLVRSIGVNNARQREAFSSVLPLGLVAVCSLVLAGCIELTGAAGMIGTTSRLLPARELAVAQEIVQYGTLLAISIAMSARLFPLYIRTRPAARLSLLVVAAMLVIGLSLHAIGTWTGGDWTEFAGQVVLIAAATVAIWTLGLLRRRRVLPRQQQSPFAEPMQWFALLAYGWLMVALVTGLVRSLDAVGVVTTSVSASVERHAFGAGFVTLLILGVGQSLLPGFAKVTVRIPLLTWMTLALGNIAVLFRVLASVDQTSLNGAERLGATAGLAGVVALLLFAWNCRLVEL